MNEVLEFIKRRFSVDCNWTTGNCYYFAIILKDCFSSGKIFYDVINGHFIFFYDGKYYDPEFGLVEGEYKHGKITSFLAIYES